MKRRAFIAALGGAAAWPVVARVQQPERATDGITVRGCVNSDEPKFVSWFAAYRNVPA
jgi:hypothetical protein